MFTLLYLAGLALVVALLVAIHLKLDALPLRIWCLMQKGLDGKPAVDVLVAELRRLHDEQAELVRVDRGLAEVRDRKHRERLRAIVDAGRGLERVLAALGIIEREAPAPSAGTHGARPTGLPSADCEAEELGDDEKTKVQGRPREPTLVAERGGGAS
jgi:hypothetical protein